MPLGLLVLLGITIHAVIRSSKKWMTVLFAVLGVFGTFLAIYEISVLFPSLNAAILDDVVIPLSLAFGALAALIHAGLNKIEKEDAAVKG